MMNIVKNFNENKMYKKGNTNSKKTDKPDKPDKQLTLQNIESLGSSKFKSELNSIRNNAGKISPKSKRKIIKIPLSNKAKGNEILESKLLFSPKNDRITIDNMHTAVVDAEGILEISSNLSKELNVIDNSILEINKSLEIKPSISDNSDIDFNKFKDVKKEHYGLR